jgi:TRAP-type uncharacterized transport system fused permease subunit
VAVVSSALNGMISGSSVSNVVSGGIFTIPMMKKAGYGGVKAGAIETMSSVNGQIMPPVMGAAAFLMVEYVGIPYSDVVRHAFLPAALSYLGLLYIVHLEALKLGIQPMPWARGAALARPADAHADRHQRLGHGGGGRAVLPAAVLQERAGRRRALGGGGTLLALYLVALRQAAASPDLPEDIDVHHPQRLETWPTVRAGAAFLIPIGVLIWCLMVEEMSPALSAFWA